MKSVFHKESSEDQINITFEFLSKQTKAKSQCRETAVKTKISLHLFKTINNRTLRHRQAKAQTGYMKGIKMIYVFDVTLRHSQFGVKEHKLGCHSAPKACSTHNPLSYLNFNDICLNLMHKTMYVEL